MFQLERQHLKYIAIFAVVALVTIPTVIVTVSLTKTPPQPGANLTYTEAVEYCGKHAMRLPSHPDELVFDWWTLADYEARNAKDGRVMFWSEVEVTYKQGEINLTSQHGQVADIERFIKVADKLAINTDGEMLAVLADTLTVKWCHLKQKGEHDTTEAGFESTGSIPRCLER